jgi:AP-2 complex subunit alpha
MLSETHELNSAVVRAIGRDLASSNEISVCLALQAIANIGSREMAESLSAEVEQLLVNGWVL